MLARPIRKEDAVLPSLFCRETAVKNSFRALIFLELTTTVQRAPSPQGWARRSTTHETGLAAASLGPEFQFCSYGLPSSWSFSARRR